METTNFTNITQLLDYKNLWEQCTPIPLKVHAKQIFESYQRWYYSRSKTLQETLNRTLARGYSNNTLNAYFLLFALCRQVSNYKNLSIYSNYKYILAEESTNLNETNIQNVLNIPHSANTNTFYISLNYIPKGKSYIRKILDANTTHERLTQIETYCISNPSHFVRIYRNFQNTGANVITVITDEIHPNLISNLFVMLPHLMEIKPTENNTLITDILELFEVLYKVMLNQIKYNAELTNIITPILTKITNKIDFTTNQLNTFVTNLTNLKNTQITSHTQGLLSDTRREIERLESSLIQKYAQKTTYEKQLIAFKTLTKADTQPLIDTIKNTPGISIINASDDALTLSIVAPLQFFESNDFAAYEANTDSNYNRNYKDHPILRSILHKIFITKEYQILVEGVIRLRLNNVYNDTPLHLEASRNSDDYSQLANPHLHYYDCWHAAKTAIHKHINNSDFTLAIMQMVAAVQTINVAEPQSFISHFLSDFKETSWQNKIHLLVKTPSGKETVTFAELYKREAQLLKETQPTQQTTKPAYTQIEIPNDDDDDDDGEDAYYDDDDDDDEDFEDGFEDDDDDDDDDEDLTF